MNTAKFLLVNAGEKVDTNLYCFQSSDYAWKYQAWYGYDTSHLSSEIADLWVLFPS